MMAETPVEGPFGPVEVRTVGRRGTFSISGVPGPAGREMAERVRSAIEAAGYAFPPDGVAVSAIPELRASEAGSWPVGWEGALDLAVAVAVLWHARQIGNRVAGLQFCAGLSLGGELRPVRGSFTYLERARGSRRVLVGAEESASVFALVEGARFKTHETLRDVLVWLADHCFPSPSVGVGPKSDHVLQAVDKGGASDVNRTPGTVVQIPPGSVVVALTDGDGTVAFARGLGNVLGPPSSAELPNILRAADAAGLEPVARRPFRAPHHTVPAAAVEAEWLLAVHGVLYFEHAELLGTAVLRKLAELGARDRVVVLSVSPGWPSAWAQTVGEPTIMGGPSADGRWFWRADRSVGDKRVAVWAGWATQEEAIAAVEVARRTEVARESIAKILGPTIVVRVSA